MLQLDGFPTGDGVQVKSRWCWFLTPTCSDWLNVCFKFDCWAWLTVPHWLPVSLRLTLTWKCHCHTPEALIWLYLLLLWQQLGPQADHFCWAGCLDLFSVCLCVHVCAQADQSAGRLTGSMMELQTLQEALKVEIQIHQVRCALRPLGQWVRRGSAHI